MTQADYAFVIMVLSTACALGTFVWSLRGLTKRIELLERCDRKYEQRLQHLENRFKFIAVKSLELADLNASINANMLGPTSKEDPKDKESFRGVKEVEVSTDDPSVAELYRQAEEWATGLERKWNKQMSIAEPNANITDWLKRERERLVDQDRKDLELVKELEEKDE